MLVAVGNSAYLIERQFMNWSFDENYFDDEDQVYEDCLRETDYELEEQNLPKDIDDNFEFCVEHQMFFDDCECAFEI